MIEQVVLSGFRRFTSGAIRLTPEINLLVGDNEAGKSTVFEAITACLTGRIKNAPGSDYLPVHVLNRQLVANWVNEVRRDARLFPAFPEAFIEVHLAANEGNVHLRGTNNGARADVAGLRLDIRFDDTFASSVPELIEGVRDGGPFPIEYYSTDWYTFAGEALHSRKAPFASHLIDATRIRLDSGSSYFVKKVIDETLDAGQQHTLSGAFRQATAELGNRKELELVNEALQERAKTVTSQGFTLQPAESTGLRWTDAFQPHLDELPFESVGMGQSSQLKILLALSKKASTGDVFLVEEPENHLSHSNLNRLIKQIARAVPGKQVIVATHSSFVANKLGLGNIVMINGGSSASLSDLTPETVDFFRKLSGFETLRLILCKGAFLVEGPSDDLVVQRFFLDRYGALPIEMGYDVIECRGLTAGRMIELARIVGRRVAVITDNDGDVEAALERYGDVSGDESIKVFTGLDRAIETLEPQIAAANSTEVLQTVINQPRGSKVTIQEWMAKDDNKTSAALDIFSAEQSLKAPGYIEEALTWLVG